MASSKEISVGLSDGVVRVVVKAASTGSPYLRFERDEKPRVILFEQSWNRLKLVSPQVSAILAGNESNQLREWLLNDSDKGQQKLLVITYREVTYVGIHSFDDRGLRIQGRAINLKTDEWASLLHSVCELDGAMTMLKSREDPGIKSEVRLIPI